MNRVSWQKAENRVLLIVALILLVFLLSAIEENRVQRQQSNYQPPSRGF